MTNRLNVLLILLSIWMVPSSLFAQDPCVEAGYELSFAVTDVDCKGDTNGEITVNSTGCDCFFSGCIMDWTNSAGEVVDNPLIHTVTDLPADVYTVEITHPNGCILSGTTELKENPHFVEDVIVNPIKCAGETASIDLVQAELTGVLDVTWNNGVAGPNQTSIDQLGPGEYEFTAVNYLGCSETYSVSIPAVEEFSYDVEILSTCEGEENGTANVVTTGGTPPFVAFLNSNLPTTDLNLKNLEAGMHDVLLVDANNCETAFSFEVTEEELPAPTIDATATEICIGAEVQLEAIMNDTDCEYTWSPASSLNVSDTQVVTASPDETTTYIVVATSPNGCQSAQEITVEVKACTSGIGDDFSELFTVHPNPNRGVFALNSSDVSEMSIYDLVGRQVYNWQTDRPNEVDLQVDLTEETNGIYLMVLTQQSGQQLTVKVIKE